MKKPTENINSFQATPFVWVLILLVSFFSSCTIRKGIQAEFDIPVTKQLNPSKAVSGNQSVCHYSQTNIITKAVTQDFNTNSGDFLQITEKSNKPLWLSIYKTSRILTGWPLTSKIDSYILFRQIKSWINF